MNILLSKYGNVISDKSLGKEILEEIEKDLKQYGNVTIDFSEIQSMATFCSKQIFGYLYVKMKPEDFYNKIIFKNANEDVKLLIRIGIQSAIEELDN